MMLPLNTAVHGAPVNEASDAATGAPTGAPAAPPADGAAESDFEEFDVALRDVLDQAALADADEQASLEERHDQDGACLPTGAEAALSALWLQYIGFPDGVDGDASDGSGSGGAEGVEQTSTPDSEDAAADLAFAAARMIQTNATGGGAANGATSATATGQSPQMAEVAGQGAREIAKRAPESGNVLDGRAHDASPALGEGAMGAADAPSEGDAATTRAGLSSLNGSAGHPVASLATSISSRPAAAVDAQSASKAESPVDWAAAIGQAVQEAQREPSLGGGSEDRGRGERQASPESNWLQRSSSLESRLSPPASFMMPSAGSPASSQASVGGSAHSVAGFEMPEPAENLSRLVQTFRIQARDGMSQANLRLHPEHLGEVTIAIRVQSGVVTAVVRAEAGDVRQWLRGQEDSIRAVLAEQGLTLDEFVVEQDGQPRQEGEQEPEQQRRRNRSRVQPMNTSTFEVTV